MGVLKVVGIAGVAVVAVVSVGVVATFTAAFVGVWILRGCK